MEGDKIMVKFQFQDESIRKAYEERIKKFQMLADKEVNEASYLWDATVKRHAITMERVKTLLEAEGINELVTSKMMKNLNSFLARCSNAEFHIALVGAIKAGKSTLINAILGHRYASTKVTPETAALTKFRKADYNYVRVSFYTAEEWQKLWSSAEQSRASVFLEEYEVLGAEKEKECWLGQEPRTFKCDTKDELVGEISKWTSSKSSTHYFVKEVEVGLSDFGLPNGVVLVDTPGLDDVVEYRSNITRDYIDRANAVLVCVKSDALTGQEMATIYSVFSKTRYNPGKVYIIATQLDTLNRPRQNWTEQREEWLKYLKGRGAYGSLELAQNNLIPVSAYLYTLLKEYDSYNEGDEKYWELDSILSKLRIRIENIYEHYQELIDFTNIALLKNKMDREIVSNYKKMLVEDIVSSYEMCREEIRETILKIKAAQEDIIKTSQGGIEEIRKKQKEYTQKYQEAQEDKEELNKLLLKLQVATKKRADDLESAIRGLGGQ